MNNLISPSAWQQVQTAYNPAATAPVVAAGMPLVQKPVWQYDPRRSDPSFFSSMPIGDWEYRPGKAGAYGGSSLPSTVSWKALQDISNFAYGLGPSVFDRLPTSFDQLSYSDPQGYGRANHYNNSLYLTGGKALSAGLIDPSKLSADAAKYLSGASNYLTGGLFSGPGETTWKPGDRINPFTQGDFDVIRSGAQGILDQDRLYSQELLNRIQSGQIKVSTPDAPSFFEKAMLAVPAIAGAAFGGPIGGALGGAFSGGITGGKKGALFGGLSGGIAGAGGLGSVLGKTSSALGGSTGGLMNTITSGLRSIATSNLNPFGWLGGGLQDLFGSNALTRGAGSALSLAGPGALFGGLLGGKKGALLGGLGGAGLGLNLLGTGSILNGTYGGGLMGNLFGGNQFSGLFGGGGSGGGTAGGGASGGLLDSLFGGGGLGSLVAGGIPLALLTREADRATNTPTATRTPFSSVSNGFANLDPAVRQNLLSSLANINALRGPTQESRMQSRGLINEGIGGLRDVLGKVSGNQNAFIQARVNPLMAQAAQRRGELGRSLGQRGVSGSSFGDQALSRFDIDSQNAIGDARAMATQESLGMQSNLNQALQQGGTALGNLDLANLGFQGQLEQLAGQGGMNLLQSELSALGLGNLDIQNLLQRAKLRTDLFGRAADQFGTLLGG